MLDPEFSEPVPETLKHLALSLGGIGCVGNIDSRFEESSPQQAGQRFVRGLFPDKACRLQLLKDLNDEMHALCVFVPDVRVQYGRAVSENDAPRVLIGQGFNNRGAARLDKPLPEVALSLLHPRHNRLRPRLSKPLKNGLE